MERFKYFWTEYILPFIVIAAGAVIAAFALEEFLVPFLILDGGVVGISMILSQITGIGLGIFTIVLNIPFLILGWRKLGVRFLVQALFGMLVFSLMLGVFEDMPALTDEDLLVVVFGGFSLGIGVGLILRAGGCLDGTEIVALILSKKSSFSVGQIVLGFNVVIYAVAGVLFGLDRALFSLLTYLITSKVIDLVETGLDTGKAAMIITDNGREIADQIYQKLGRTCTIIDGYGLVSGQKTVLYCVITRLELSTLKHIIHDADGTVFMTITDVGEIVGQHIKKTDETVSASLRLENKEDE